MTLRIKLALFLLPLVAAPLLLMGHLANNFLYSSSRETALTQMATTLWQVNHTIQNRVEQTQTQFDLLVDNQQFSQYITHHTEHQSTRGTLTELFARQTKIFGAKYDLRLLTADGHIHTQYSNDNNWALTQVPQNLFALLPTPQENIRLELLIHIDMQEPVLLLTKALQHQENKFYIALSLDADFITSTINKTLIGSSGFLFIANPEGEVVFKPRGKLASAQLPRQFPSAQFSEYLTHLGGYNAFTSKLGNHDVYFQVKKLFNGMYLFAVMPSEGIEQKGQLLRVFLTIIMAFSMLVTFALLFVMLHFLVIHPVQQLAHASQRVGAGNFSTQLKVKGKGKDEIGDLAHTFNWMMNQLQVAYEQLEQAKQYLEIKVKERTQELEDLNHELMGQRKKAEEANQAKTFFMANMSHELRTPLNGVLGMAELLSYSNLDDKQKKRLQILRHSANNLMDIINEILDITSLDAGKLELEIFPFDMVESIYNITQNFQQKAKEKGLELTVSGLACVPQQISADKRRFEQILENLLENAVKFTDKGSVFLNIETKEYKASEVTLSFSVEDTGIGIPAEKQAHIFEKFNQVDNSSTRQFGGTGLGLSISYQLVQLMDGEMGLESTPGNGARFWFVLTLPLIIPPNQSLN